MDADRRTPDAARAHRLGRIKLLVLAAFFTLPVAAGYLAYSWWTPAQGSNYGELLSPRPLISGRGARCQAVLDLCSLWAKTRSGRRSSAGREIA